MSYASANNTNHFPCCRQWRCEIFRTLPCRARSLSILKQSKRNMVTSGMPAVLIHAYLRHFYRQIDEIAEKIDDIWSSSFRILMKYWSKFSNAQALNNIMPFKPMTIRVSGTNSEVNHHPASWVTLPRLPRTILPFCHVAENGDVLGHCRVEHGLHRP